MGYDHIDQQREKITCLKGRTPQELEQNQVHMKFASLDTSKEFVNLPN